MKNDDNPPWPIAKDDAAFPARLTGYESLGMSKREFFAITALQGYIANGVVSVNTSSGIWTPDQVAAIVGRKQREAAMASVEMADALLEALKNTWPA